MRSTKWPKGQADDLGRQRHHHAAEQQPDSASRRADRKIGPAWMPVSRRRPRAQATS